MPRNEHFLPRNNGNPSESIRGFFSERNSVPNLTCNSQLSLNGHATLTCTHYPPKGTSGHHNSWPNSSASCQQMPPLTQTCSTLSRETLAATDYPNARALAAAADRIWDLHQTAPPAVAAAAPTRDRSRSPHGGNRNSRRDSHRRSPSRRRRGPAQTPHHNTQENDNGICWHHNKFQHKSYRCISPCRWQGNSVSSR
jgi:hypothetical protein